MTTGRTGRKKKTRKTTLKRSRPKRGRKDGDIGNGLRNFSMHAFDQKSAPILAKLQGEQASRAAFALGAPATIPQLDPETIAKGYLNQAFASSAVRSFTAPKSGGVTSDFKSLGTESIPLTGTKTVKFRQ